MAWMSQNCTGSGLTHSKYFQSSMMEFHGLVETSCRLRRYLVLVCLAESSRVHAGFAMFH